MSFTISKLASVGLFFLLIYLSGIWLHRRGSPYNMLLVTGHKLLGLAAGIFLGINIYRIYKIAPLGTGQIVAIAVTIALFAINVATGSLLSTNKPMPKTISVINKFFPYLTVISTAVMLYLLL